MAAMQHPPPPPLRGLLSVKRGGQFSRRVHRLARLEAACLELRLRETEPVECSLCLIDARVQPDASSFCIALSAPAFRLRLYAHSEHKYHLWLNAIRASALWKVHNFYDIASDQILGAGQFATVYKALDRGTKRPVAVKAVPTQTAARERAPEYPYLAQLVARECRISRLVDHESVVAIRDVFESPDRVYIVMQYAAYTLQDVMKTHTVLTEAHAAAVIRQVLDGIAYLHNRNIVHRDIKPDNILCSNLAEPVDVRICDFGLANFTGKRVEALPVRKWRDERLIPKRMRNQDAKMGDEGSFGPYSRPLLLAGLVDPIPEKKKRGSIGFHAKDARVDALEDACGSLDRMPAEPASFGSAIDGLTLTSAIGAPSYVAPELVKGQRYGKPVDIWGCGVLLFLMLSGYLPFEGKNAAEVVRKIKECEPDLDTGSWSHVSEGAKQFVRCLLHADPMRRITLDCALENEWLSTAGQEAEKKRERERQIERQIELEIEREREMEVQKETEVM